MCLLVIAWKTHPEFLLIAAANRDEFYQRPTKHLEFWPDMRNILAGRDLLAGGSWLGINRLGYFAALTNIRGYQNPHQSLQTKSRGLLVSQYLAQNPINANKYNDTIVKDIDSYNGFNLLTANRNQLFWLNSKNQIKQELAPGIYGLSNAKLDTPWPKLIKAKTGFAKIIKKAEHPEEMQAQLFALFADSKIANDEELPHTGVSLEWERKLSAIFIRSVDYGTRSTTLLFIHKENHVTMMERHFDSHDSSNNLCEYNFKLDDSIQNH